MGKQPNGGSTGSGGTHRWAVDQVEEGTAAVEQDGDHVYQLPRWLLPAGARDGDVFTASPTTNGDGSVTITVRRDETAAATAKSARQGRRRPLPDRGGDIVL